MDKNPVITRRPDGEYSTVLIGTDIIETMWFGDDGSTKMVGRTVLSKRNAAAAHIAAFEAVDSRRG